MIGYVKIEKCSHRGWYKDLVGQWYPVYKDEGIEWETIPHVDDEGATDDDVPVPEETPNLIINLNSTQTSTTMKQQISLLI